MLVNIIQNTISSFISAGISVITTNLKIWLGFETSETLGREEVVNGDFSDGTNNWTTSNSTISIEGGALKITSTGGNRPQANQTVSGLNIGSQYKLSAIAKRGTTANDVEIEISGVASASTSNRNSTTEYETIFYTFIATATSHTIQAKIDEAVEPSGTTAYFSNVSLKELTQITPDKSGNNNVGELFTGKALEFDGSTEYVDLGNSISNTTYDATTKITIVGWFQIEQTSDMLFSQGTNFYLFNDGNGDLKLQGGSNVTNFGSTPSGMNRIVTVLDGLNVRGYINGVEVANQTIPTFTTDSNNLILGKFYSNAFFLNGLIADFQVYNSAWTQDDVTYDYANPNKLAIDNPSTNLVVTNLKGYWALSEGDGLVAYDSGTNLEEEEVVDGDFSSSVNWADSGNQWVINNNTATYTGDNTANELLQEISFIGGRTYQIKIDVASISGALKVRFNNEEVNKVAFNQTGIQTLYITATGSGNITDDLSISRETGTVSAVLNSVSVREVTASDHGGLIVGADYVDAQPRIPQLGMQNWSKGSNSLIFSEDFSNAVWTKGTGTSVTGGFTDPLGGNTAYKASYDGVGSQPYIFDDLNNITNMRSVWARTVSGTGQIHLTSHNSNSNSLFNLTTVWQRVSAIPTSGSGVANYYLVDFRGSTDLTEVLVWGAQIDDGTTLGAYRLTDGAATLNSTVIPNPTIPTKDIFGNLVRDRLNSFNLDGSGYADAGANNIASDYFTVDAWVYKVSNSQAAIFNTAESSTPFEGTDCYISSTGQIGTFADNGFRYSSTTIQLNQWNYIAWKFYKNSSNGTIKASLNGEAFFDIFTGDTGSSNLLVNDGKIQIGRYQGDSNYWDGLISDVRLYDRALTATEVENNYNAGLSAHTN